MHKRKAPMPVPGMFSNEPSVLPPSMNGLEDGIHVFVDTRMERSVNVELPGTFLHEMGQGEEEMTTPNTTTASGVTKAIASMFITVRETNRIGQELLDSGSCKTVCRGCFSSDTYSHAVVFATSPDKQNVKLSVEFVSKIPPPETVSEVFEPSLLKNYTFCIKTNASYMTEIHKDSDTKYIHGMRKMIAHIGWAMARAPTCNMKLPLMPPGMDVNECLEMIRQMQLEIATPGLFGDQEEEKTTVMTRKNPIFWRLPEDEAMKKSEEIYTEEDVKRGLYNTYQKCMETDDALNKELVSQMGIKQVPLVPHPSVDMMTMNDDDPDREKTSVFPIGMITSRQSTHIPMGLRIMGFMRSLMPGYFTREIAYKALMGAFCAYYRDDRYSKLFPTDKTSLRTHFVEDIECDEMHTFGDYVTESIKGMMDTKNTKRKGVSDDIRSFFGITWSGQKIVVHAVKVGGAGNWTPKQGKLANQAVFGFAFCKEGVSRPFALTGMRHVIYHHMKQVLSEEPPEYDAVLGVRCLRNQYSMHKDKMMEEFASQINPSTSTLNHRERFALQLSFIHQACTIHKHSIGLHKKMLRALASDWYHRRLGKNESRAVSMGLPVDSFICPQKGMIAPDYIDMSFIVSAINVTKKDVQPFWCFASTIF